MPKTTVGTIEINNEQIEITADTSGMWTFKHDDEVIAYGSDFDKLKSTVSTKLSQRKVKVAVPFVSMFGKRGIATGIHGRTNKVTVQMNEVRGKSKSKNEQWDNYIKVFRADTPTEQLDLYTDLQAEKARIEKEMGAITQEYATNIGTLVQDAITAATGQAFVR